ncbi:MAG: hypothetical protein ACOYT4_03675 [Nanoarchaeota archaeon]
MSNAQKFLIFDAGPIISLTMNGLLNILEKLKQNFSGEFIITPDIKFEVIDRPLKIKKYSFEALQVKNLLDKGILKLSSEFVKDSVLVKETQKILNISNSILYADENIKLIQRGEASCLAFANLCKKNNVIAIDERTTRMISEAPDKLKQLMENKLHTKINVNEQNLKLFGNFKFIRSTELIYIAYKKNLFDLKKDKILLDALLYAVKFKGVAVSSSEIEEIKKLA